MFSIILLIFTLLLHALFIVTASLLITVVFGSVDIFTSTLWTFLFWAFYIFSSEYIVLYFFNVKTAKLNSELRDIISLFSFKNQDRLVRIYSSENAPIVMRIGLLNSSKIIINEKILSTFEPVEIKTILDLELTYAKTISSLTEVLLQKLFFLTWLPIRSVFDRFIEKEIIDYFLGPMVSTYKFISIKCRKKFIYSGKFLETLPQVIFKIKISSSRDEKIKLFGYSLRNLDVLGSSSESVRKDASRFNLDEFLQ